MRPIAPLRQTGRQPFGDDEIAFELAQQQNPALRGQPPPVEGKRHFVAANRSQIEGKTAILIHGGCGAP